MRSFIVALVLVSLALSHAGSLAGTCGCSSEVEADFNCGCVHHNDNEDTCCGNLQKDSSNSSHEIPANSPPGVPLCYCTSTVDAATIPAPAISANESHQEAFARPETPELKVAYSQPEFSHSFPPGSRMEFRPPGRPYRYQFCSFLI